MNYFYVVGVHYLFFFFKQKTAYEIMPSLVGSEMCIRDRSSTAGLLKAGYERKRTLAMWVLIVVISGVSAALGYALLGDVSPLGGAAMLTFAGGAILTMLADSMMPEAFKDTGKLAGLLTTFGFAVIWILGVR